MNGAESAPMDPLARAGAIGLGCARIAIGVGAFGFTRRALQGLGFKQPGPESIALARLAGGRDIALGVHTLLAAGDRRKLREAVAVTAAVDVGDAVSFAAGLRGSETLGRTAAINAPLGAAAAVAGAWVYSRL